jgi:hypothetical protein
MKLVVVIPSSDYASWAGARIRYHRIRRELAAAGVELLLEDIASFDPFKTDCDAVCLSKCHDPKSLMVAAILSDRGTLVGIDLFDDYFSDATDSRLLRYREWLAAIIQSCDFALCSTDPLAQLVRRYHDGIPTHVLNDPAADHDVDRLADIVGKKLAEARLTRRLKVAWFGVGDNPFFPAGLPDLAAFGGILSHLSRGGMSVELTILTNGRALSAEGLSLISSLPVPTTVAEWSEDAEQRLLADALLAFLPVSGQSFSAAKSLNRAVTALSAGCQVLSVGYPLYEALDALIYRDPEGFSRDLENGSLRISGTRLDDYVARMEALASAPVEAGRLADFLFELRPGDRVHHGPLALVHGHSTRTDAHRLVQEAGGFSVASPFCSAALDFDVVFRTQPFGLEMLLSPSAARRLRPGTSVELLARRKIGGSRYRIASHGRGALRTCGAASAAHMRPLPVQFATYKTIMHHIHELMSAAFGPVRMVMSETSRLPFQS